MLRRNFAIVIAAALVVLGCDRGPSEPQSVFSVSPENPNLFPEAGINLDLSLNPAAISPAQISWSSSSPNVASVDDNGRVTGISPGSAVIKAKGTNGFVETTVTVVAGGAPFHAGYSVTCGISTTNETYCWGDNAGGQLGIGTTGSAQPLPQRVSGGLQFSSIGGGYGHTCGMTAAGAFCWGEAWWGAIGDGTRGDFSRMVPTKVVSGESLLQVDANGGRNLSGAECSDEICHGHSVGLDNSGRAFWWGTELHSGTPSTGLIAVQSLVPTPVETDQRFFRISAGVEYTCGITTDHAAYCWGLNS